MFDKPTRLKNVSCPYCGALLESARWNEDHVIGRRFVPKGKLHQSWNLILRVCATCNVNKSTLEDDLSAASMQPDAAGGFALEDERLLEEAQRKARNSFSRRTRKPIGKSTERIEFEVPLGPGMKMTVGGISQPQMDDGRVYELARLQLQAFFYWVTYDESRMAGGFWRSGIFPVDWSFRSNWGGEVSRAFMRAVVNWRPNLLLTGTASGFFRAAIRRHPTAACWAWALEWNHNVRVMGFFGDQKTGEAIAREFPNPQGVPFPQPDGSIARLRADRALSVDEDILFAWKEEEAGLPQVEST